MDNKQLLSEIKSLLEQLRKLPFASPRSYLGLLKFWGLVRTQALQAAMPARYMSVHEDILYDALHMQLLIALLDQDIFERVYKDLQ